MWNGPTKKKWSFLARNLFQNCIIFGWRMEATLYVLQNTGKEVIVHMFQIKTIHMDYSVDCFIWI